MSYPNGKGKVSVQHVLNQIDIAGLDSVLGEKDATHNELIATGKRFSSVWPAEEYVYECCQIRDLPSLNTLSPTDLNLALHTQRGHLQMMLWKAADRTDPPDVKINDYG